MSILEKGIDVLAILGGEPIRCVEWPLWPMSSDTTSDRLKDVLKSGRWTVRGWWTGKPTNDELFSKAFADLHDVPYCVPTASGSAALTIALEALDVGAGDEVIVPALTWPAPAIAVVNVNAIPIIVDVDPATLCMAPKAVEAAISEKTRCILPVHLHCTLVDMDAICEIVKNYHLKVIEDCSQAHTAEWSGRKVGTFGDIGIFSMNQEKILPAGEAGAAITADPILHRRMEQLRSDGSLFIPQMREMFQYQSTEPGEVMGSNYCPSEFQTAILLDQLNSLDRLQDIRLSNASYLTSLLEKVEGISPLRQDPRVTRPTFFKYAVRCDRSKFAGRPLEVICAALTAELGLPLHPTDAPLHRNPLFQPLTKKRHRLGPSYEAALDLSRYELPTAEAAFQEVIVFHHRALLGRVSDMDDIYAAFEKIQRFAFLLPAITI